MSDWLQEYFQARAVQRKVFVSFSHLNQQETETFLSAFEEAFIAKVLGVNGGDDFIDSSKLGYVMQYIGDATVTIVLIGGCSHSRRYVDWEIKTSLQQGEDAMPNGLIGILLPSTGGGAHLPERFSLNWKQAEKDWLCAVPIIPDCAPTALLDRGRCVGADLSCQMDSEPQRYVEAKQEVLGVASPMFDLATVRRRYKLSFTELQLRHGHHDRVHGIGISSILCSYAGRLASKRPFSHLYRA